LSRRPEARAELQVGRAQLMGAVDGHFSIDTASGTHIYKRGFTRYLNRRTDSSYFVVSPGFSS
jgi:hypothetical protein